MTLDSKVDRAALFAHLLELNVALCGNAFALDGDQVVLVAERSSLDLDRSELVDIIRRVTTNADHHDDLLVSKFGGTLGEAPGA
jgi:5,10-methylenetetrahydrofolate reductase